MNGDFLAIMEEITGPTELQRDEFIEWVKNSIFDAVKKKYREPLIVSDEESGGIKLYSHKKVVNIMRNFATEIQIEVALKINPEVNIGDEIKVEIELSELDRGIIQDIRQNLVQKIREAERKIVYDMYQDREGEIISGRVLRVDDGNNIILEIDRAEAILPPSEQVPGEEYRRGNQIRCLILEVKNTSNATSIIVSRQNPGLIAQLFELEVPEIFDGLVQIMGIARDPGDRSKVAVAATEENIDAVGTCVGVRGSRVQMVAQELLGEKIDIIAWDPDPAIYIGNALQPATVIRVITSEDEDVAGVIVPDDQLSLAIGKRGQNARLAARLTGWKIDIKNESQAGEVLKELKEQLTEGIFKSEQEIRTEKDDRIEIDDIFDEIPDAEDEDVEEDELEEEELEEEELEDISDEEFSFIMELNGITPEIAEALIARGFATIQSIAEAKLDVIAYIPEIGAETAEKIQDAALEMLENMR